MELLGGGQNTVANVISPTHRFEAQLTAVKERLEAAKQGSTRGLPSMDGSGGFSFGGSRIAKPLRGGGGGGPESSAPVAESAKRTSWFFDRR